MPFELHLVAHLDADALVLTTVEGAEHSRFSVEDVDAVAAIECWETRQACDDSADGSVRRLWSLEELDAALVRYGYRRTGPWRHQPAREPPGPERLPGGPVADVTG